MRSETRNLIVLVPDADIEQTIRGLLSRTDLGFRPIPHEVRRHPGRDPGCRTGAVEFLRPFLSSYDYALVVFDRDGCGSSEPREKIQCLVEERLRPNGWKDRAKVIVIEPELEAWLWNGSPLVAQELGWDGDYAGLREYLKSEDLWPASDPKPPDPKRAMKEVMSHAKLKKRARRSPAKFKQLACRTAPAILTGCQDAAFRDLADILGRWFPKP